jgi:hypothetical protein
MSIIDIHDGLSRSILIYCALMAIWGMWRFFRGQGLSGGYLGAVVIAEVLLVVQGAIGVILWFGAGTYQPSYVHWIYGIVLALSAPLVYTYTKGRQDRPEMLLYAVAYVIMIALVLRAMVTATG